MRPLYQNATVEATSSTGPYARACQFYGVTSGDHDRGETRRSDVPFITAFEDLAVLSTVHARATVNCGDATRKHNACRALESFVKILALQEALVRGLASHDELAVGWEPARWLGAVLPMLEQVCGIRGCLHMVLFLRRCLCCLALVVCHR